MNNPYYRPDRRLLSAMGQWPYQSDLAKGLLRSIIIIGGLSMLVPMLIGICQSWGDVDTTIECVPPILVSIVGFIMYINAIINNGKLKILMDKVDRDWETWSSKPEVEILKKCAIEGRSLRVTFGSFLCGALGLFLVMPLLPQLLNILVPLNESRPKIPLFIAEFYIDQEEYYFWIYIHNYVTTFFFILFILIGDVMLMGSVQHAYGVLAAIGSRLSNIMTNEDRDPKIENDLKQQIIDDITFCANEHKKVIIYIKDIHECCSTAFFVTIAINMLSISVTGVQTVTHLDRPDEAMRFGTSTLNQIVHLYCLSVPCEKLITYSNSISDSIYSGNWYQFPVKSKKLLLMIMKKSSEPCSFTAGKIYTYSMQSFATVLRTAMSYFTVLSSFQ